MIVGTTPRIAIPVAAFMGSVATIVGPAPQIRCNNFGRGRPMIAIPAADDCGSLQVVLAARRAPDLAQAIIRNELYSWRRLQSRPLWRHSDARPRR